jgi:hypothetical protein
MTPEKTIETKLRRGIEKLGGACIKIPATFFAGIPDRLCLLPGGRAFFVETKAQGLRPRPRQEYVRRQLEGLGFKVYLVNSLDGVTALLDLFGPKSLTRDEERELAELTTARRLIIEQDLEDDLSREDLARMYELMGKKAGF